MKKIIVIIAVLLVAGGFYYKFSSKMISHKELKKQKVSMQEPESKRLRFFNEINAGDNIKKFGVTGKNVRVVVMGEIADAMHPDLKKRIHKQYNTYSQKGKVLEGKGNMPYLFEKFGQDNGHGTHIAGTIAAECDGKGIQGVACGATIDVYDIGAYGNEDMPMEGWDKKDNEVSILLESLKTAIKDVASKKESKIITGSFNIESPYIKYKNDSQLRGKSIAEISQRIKTLKDLSNSKLVSFENEADKDYLERVFNKNEKDDGIIPGTLIPFSKEWADLEDAIAAYQKTGGVYIVTESNNVFDGKTSVFNAMPTISKKVDPDLWISAVLAVPNISDDSNVQIEDTKEIEKYGYKTILNSCGESAEKYCLLVPSYDVVSTMMEEIAETDYEYFILDGRGYQSFTGHSMGAPMIAGALALMQEYNEKAHKGYEMKDLVRILKETANRSFKGYNPKIHGQGMIDIKAALQAM